MDPKLQKDIGEVSKLIGDTWKGIAVTAGINAGLFDILSSGIPVSIEEISVKKNYDPDKLEKWFYYMENEGIVTHENGKYCITPKGYIFTEKTPAKELLGLLQLTDFFMMSAVNSKDNFQKELNEDKLTEGKLSILYQSKVTDNFSSVILDHLKPHGLGGSDSLMDFGCGKGNFLCGILSVMPGMRLIGIDLNPHAIEHGTQLIQDRGISDKISLKTGNVTIEMKEYEDRSIDWVTAINIFHFIPVHLREEVIHNMIRICKKGVCFTEPVVETNPNSYGANTLMPLLWNDFTGFFKRSEADLLNQNLEKEYENFSMEITPIMHGSSYLIVMLRKE